METGQILVIIAAAVMLMVSGYIVNELRQLVEQKKKPDVPELAADIAVMVAKQIASLFSDFAKSTPNTQIDDELAEKLSEAADNLGKLIKEVYATGRVTGSTSPSPSEGPVVDTEDLRG